MAYSTAESSLSATSPSTISGTHLSDTVIVCDIHVTLTGAAFTRHVIVAVVVRINIFNRIVWLHKLIFAGWGSDRVVRKGLQKRKSLLRVHGLHSRADSREASSSKSRNNLQAIPKVAGYALFPKRIFQVAIFAIFCIASHKKIVRTLCAYILATSRENPSSLRWTSPALCA